MIEKKDKVVDLGSIIKQNMSDSESDSVRRSMTP